MKIMLLGRDDFNYHYILKTLYDHNDTCTIHTDSIGINYISNFDFIISYNCQFIISKDVIDKFKNRIINLHISYLPWNRGSDPNLWSWIDNTPKGVTIHQIDEGIDTGPILAQKRTIFHTSHDTLQKTWNVLHGDMEYLFDLYWFSIKNNRIKPIPQSHKGTFHLRKQRPYLPKGWDTKIEDLQLLHSKR